MPPKKGKADSKIDPATGRKKKKILAKGEGMGGTIGITDKEEKIRCVLPQVKSYVTKDACCPMEMGCTMPSMGCNQQPPCPGSTQCCYMP